MDDEQCAETNENEFSNFCFSSYRENASKINQQEISEVNYTRTGKYTYRLFQ